MVRLSTNSCTGRIALHAFLETLPKYPILQEKLLRHSHDAAGARTEYYPTDTICTQKILVPGTSKYVRTRYVLRNEEQAEAGYHARHLDITRAHSTT